MSTSLVMSILQRTLVILRGRLTLVQKSHFQSESEFPTQYWHWWRLAGLRQLCNFLSPVMQLPFLDFDAWTWGQEDMRPIPVSIFDIVCVAIRLLYLFSLLKMYELLS